MKHYIASTDGKEKPKNYRIMPLEDIKEKYGRLDPPHDYEYETMESLMKGEPKKKGRQEYWALAINCYCSKVELWRELDDLTNDRIEQFDIYIRKLQKEKEEMIRKAVRNAKPLTLERAKEIMRSFGKVEEVK